MKSILFKIIFTSCLYIASQSLLANNMIAIEFDEVISCPPLMNSNHPPNFYTKECSSSHAYDIDPQNTAMWIKAKLVIPEAMKTNKEPYSIFISGKMSSVVYFNNQYLGQNGHPSRLANEEIPGEIDSSFYVPAHLIKQKDNELIMLISSHNGFLTLARPIHFIGLGTFSNPNHFIQSRTWKSFIPFGALLLSVLYFSVKCFSPNNRKMNILFLSMSVIALVQLSLELLRSLVSYDYPIHDIRVFLIAALSFCFGCCLLLYVLVKFKLDKVKAWLILGIALALIGVISLPGYDVKTAVAILLPSALSTVIIMLQFIKHKTKESGLFLIVFLFLSYAVILNLETFHDLLYYFILTGLLGFLFIHQAVTLNKEQHLRQREEKMVAKLEYKLEQNKLETLPSKIKITSSGSVTLVSSNDIFFCKADGDYVEIHLSDDKMLLYSGSLKELERNMPSSFLRVHRSYLVNLEKIISLKSSRGKNIKSSSGGGILYLNDDRQVPVSRRIMPMVRNAIY